MKDYKDLASLEFLQQAKNRFGNPKVAGFLSPAGGGGSHFVLHKLQGHPYLVTLEENAFVTDTPGGSSTSDLKNYFTKNHFPGPLVYEQLHPRKQPSSNTRWLIMNKPPIGRLTYHRNFHYNDISFMYCFRNPIAFYYSWLESWRSYGREKYNTEPDKKMICHWFERTIMCSLYEFAQFYDPEKDHIINLEQFSSNIDNSLESVFDFLKVPAIKNKDLFTLTNCIRCNNSPLSKRMHTIHADRKDRTEEVLYCEKCGTPQIGPGHYNYIRKENNSFFSNWKNKEDSEQIFKRFSEKIDPGIMNYFEEELYLSDKDGNEFSKRMKDCLTRLYNF